MARIPILNDPAQLRTGNQTQQTAQLPAVTNASLGKALGDVVNVASNIQEMSRRANDVTYLTNASLRMNEAQKEFATFQQSPEGQDETQWLPKWKELESKLQGEIGSMPLTPNARAQLTNRFSEWSTNGTINVQSSQFKQAGVKMDALGEMAKRQSFETGNTKIYDDHVDDSVNAGLVLPQVGENLKARNADEVKRKTIADLNAQIPLLNQAAKNGDKTAPERLVEINDKLRTLGAVSGEQAKLYDEVFIKGVRTQQRIDDLMVIANNDPDRALELANEGEKNGSVPGIDRINIEREAYQAKSFKRRDAVNKYKERIVLHDIPSFEELQNDTNLTDFDRMAIVESAGGNVNDPAEFESALTAVMSFDPSNYIDQRDAITQATQMEASLEARFDGPYLDNLKTELAKRRDRDPAAPTAETDIGPAMQHLEDSINQGGYMPLERPVMKDGKQVMQDPKKIGFVMKPGWMWGQSQTDVKENDGNPVPLTEVDKVAVEKAAAVKREIRRTIEGEVKAGKLKDQSEIMARMYDLSTLKGIKVKPVQVNPLIPNVGVPENASASLEETLKKYGK